MAYSADLKGVLGEDYYYEVQTDPISMLMELRIGRGVDAGKDLVAAVPMRRLELPYWMGLRRRNQVASSSLAQHSHLLLNYDLDEVAAANLGQNVLYQRRKHLEVDWMKAFHDFLKMTLCDPLRRDHGLCTAKYHTMVQKYSL